MAARDVVFIAIVIFALGMGFFILNSVMNTTVDQIVDNEIVNQSESAVSAFESVKTAANRLDYVIFGVFIGMILALIITAWYIGSNPIFMFIFFIVIVITVAISPILSNAWEDVSQASIFGATAASFPITGNLLTYLPIYISVIGFIAIVVMFAKPYLQRQ